MKDALADVSREGVWSHEQRRSLRAVFTRLANVLNSVLLLRGERKVVEDITVGAGETLDMTVECNLRPKAVVFLDVSAVVNGEQRHITTPALLWSWSATGGSGALRVVDLLGSLPDEATYRFDMFMEKS